MSDVARPDRHRQQHHVHRGKARDREAFHQPLGLRALVGVGALRRERMRVITDGLDRRDDLGRVGLVVPPVDGQPTLGEIEPRVDDARQFVQAVLDFPDAACARHAFDSERHTLAATPLTGAPAPSRAVMSIIVVPSAARVSLASTCQC
jgi:hypothetical protein